MERVGEREREWEGRWIDESYRGKGLMGGNREKVTLVQNKQN